VSDARAGQFVATTIEEDQDMKKWDGHGEESNKMMEDEDG
jgi:hypothetical protein